MIIAHLLIVLLLFGQARLRVLPESVPSASARRIIYFHPAPDKRGGTIAQPDATEMLPRTSSTPTASNSVLGSNSSPAAPGMAHRTLDTSAQGVVPSLMELIPANTLNRQPRLSSPYSITGWTLAFKQFNLSSRYPTLLESLSTGFNAGIPVISSTFAPSNSKSLYEHKDVFDSIVQTEMRLGRYFGPFTQREVEHLIGPFQSSPLSLVPKSSSGFRLVQNLSFPHIHRSLSSSPHIASINSHIHSDDFPCTWGTFSTAALLILLLPPGSQGSCRDVADAFRTIPLAPSQWPGVVVRIAEEDQFAINTADSFGLSSAGGVWGLLADAFSDVVRAHGMGPLTKWVDDFLFLRIPRTHCSEYNALRSELAHRVARPGRQHVRSRWMYTGDTRPDGSVEEFDEPMDTPIRDLSPSAITVQDSLFTYGPSHIDALSQSLGIPWKTSKTTPFASSVTYLGFVWNIDSKTVTLSPEKTAKYLEAIEEWSLRRTHTLHQVQTLYGKLMHASHILPAGRAYLTGLEAMLPTFGDHPDRPHRPAKGTHSDLQWWALRLQNPTISRSLPTSASFPELHAFSDASSGVGIGLVIGSAWNAFTLQPGWNKDGREIAWAEAVAMELLLLTIHKVFPSATRVQVYCDNSVVVGGWRSGRSRNKAVNTVFKRIHTLTEQSGWTVIVRYVPSASNPADQPSRGVYSPGQRLPTIDLPPEVAPFLSPVPIGAVSSRPISCASAKESLSSRDITMASLSDSDAQQRFPFEHYWDI